VRIFKFPLSLLAIAALAVLWLLLLNISYAWISSASNMRAVAGAILLLMMCLVVLVAGSMAARRVLRKVNYRWRR
jgi:uncharacterized protein YhhL (DUF1145 family)